MMVKIHIQSPRETTESVTAGETERAFPFGYTLDFEATSIEEALATIDQVMAWAIPANT